MCTFILLIDTYFIEKIKSYFLNRYKNNKYILFYDSDCGFCHYSVRIIKRLDVFHSALGNTGGNETTMAVFGTLTGNDTKLLIQNVNVDHLNHLYFQKSQLFLIFLV